jgi:hypothetical protein
MSQAFVIKHSLLDHLEALYRDALLPQLGRVWRHRARLDATNVGVMSSIGYKEQDLGRIFIVEHWCRHREI